MWRVLQTCPRPPRKCLQNCNKTNKFSGPGLQSLRSSERRSAVDTQPTVTGKTCKIISLLGWKYSGEQSLVRGPCRVVSPHLRWCWWKEIYHRILHLFDLDSTQNLFTNKLVSSSKMWNYRILWMNDSTVVQTAGKRRAVESLKTLDHWF